MQYIKHRLCKKIESLEVNFVSVTSCLATIFFSCSGAIAEMSYAPRLPQFGGSNYQALSIMQFEKGLTDSIKSKKEALQREIERDAERLANIKTPAQQLVSSLTSVLQVRLAQGFADQILFGSTVGDFDIGNVNIAYTRIDGMLSLTIAEEGLEPTLIELPVS